MIYRVTTAVSRVYRSNKISCKVPGKLLNFRGIRSFITEFTTVSSTFASQCVLSCLQPLFDRLSYGFFYFLRTSYREMLKWNFYLYRDHCVQYHLQSFIRGYSYYLVLYSFMIWNASVPNIKVNKKRTLYWYIFWARQIHHTPPHCLFKLQFNNVLLFDAYISP